MSSKSIFHLEKYPFFLSRVVELNKLYSPDSDLHDLLAMDPEAWQEAAQGVDPDPKTKMGRALIVRRCLHALHANFPSGAPVHEQVAYLVRGFAGMRLFDEANFRTGWDYAGELLQHNDLALTEADHGVLGNDLFERVEAAYGPFMDKKALLDRDDVFDFLAAWFQDRIA
ncbi:MAG: hypothetical protein ACPGQL_03155 [Thermoplasmatota archaeon]